MKKVLNASLKFPKITILAWLIASIIMALNFKPFKMLITIDGLINKNFDSAIAYKNLKETFEEGTPLLFLHKNGLVSSDLCLLRTWLSRVPKSNDYIAKTHSIFSLRKPTFLREDSDSFEKLIFPQLINLSCHPKVSLNYSQAELEKSPWQGLMLNKSHYLTEMRFSSMGELNFQSKIVPKIVEGLWGSFPKELKASTSLIGEAAYQYFMKKGLRQNNLLNGALLLLVILLMRLFLGTWRSGFIFIATLITCALFLFGLMNVTRTPLDVLNNSLFILLSVASLGDFIFICHHQQQYDCSWKESFLAQIKPSFFTSLTTFLGFISLTTSDLTIIKRLGLWAALSGVIEWLVLFSLLPAVLTLTKFNKSFTSQTKSFGHGFLKKLESLKLKRGFLILFSLVYLVAPATPFFFNINDNPTLLFPKNHPFREAIRHLKSGMGYSGEVSLVLEKSASEAKDLIELEKLTQFFNGLENVSKVESPIELKNYLTSGLGPLEREVVLNNIKKSSAYTRLVRDSSYRLRIYLKETSLKEIDSLRRTVQRTHCHNKNCHLTGALVAYAEFSQEVPKTLLISLGTSLILVALVLIGLWWFHPLKGLAPLFISGFWGVAFVLVIIAVSQFKLNFVTCVVLAILVGMTGDNAIHYLLGSSKELKSGIAHKQGASILTTTIMSLCCVIFFFFSFEPPRVLGILLILGLWGSLFGDLWFLKLLLNRKADD